MKSAIDEKIYLSFFYQRLDDTSRSFITCSFETCILFIFCLLSVSSTFLLNNRTFIHNLSEHGENSKSLAYKHKKLTKPLAVTFET